MQIPPSQIRKTIREPLFTLQAFSKSNYTTINKKPGFDLELCLGHFLNNGRDSIAERVFHVSRLDKRRFEFEVAEVTWAQDLLQHNRSERLLRRGGHGRRWCHCLHCPEVDRTLWARRWIPANNTLVISRALPQESLYNIQRVRHLQIGSLTSGRKRMVRRCTYGQIEAWSPRYL